MTKNDVISKVKAKLEEISPFEDGSSLIGLDRKVNPIDSYIESNLLPALNKILVFVPVHKIPTSLITSIDLQEMVVQDMVGSYDIPKDFLRFISAKLGDWSRSVEKVVTSDEPMFAQQVNKYTRGKKTRPVVTMSDGKFFFYSVTSKDGALFKYIPLQTAVNTIDDKLGELLVLQTAILVLQIFEQNEKVSILSQELASILQA